MTPGTGSALSYGFDASGNLTTTPAGATGTYDKAGELTSGALSGTTTSYTYNADGERLTAKQGSTTTAAGTWNGASQLTAYDNSTADMTAATYDGNGLRASATSTPAGRSASTQSFVWDATTTIPDLLIDSASAYIYGSGATPAEQVNLSTGAISYLISDALGSVRGVVLSTGALTASTAYDSWGNPETIGGLTSYSSFGYAGAYTDPTGLLYLISRYYDPATGQFFSVDPAVSQTREPYQYANGNPINEVDPAGALAIERHEFEFKVFFNRLETIILASRITTAVKWAAAAVWAYLKAKGLIGNGIDDLLYVAIMEAMPAVHNQAKKALSQKQKYCVQFNWNWALGEYNTHPYISAHGSVQESGSHKGRFQYYCSGKWVKP